MRAIGIGGFVEAAPRFGAPLTRGPVTGALIAKACTRPEVTVQGDRWTYEQLGAEVGMSGSQANVILSQADIKPHRAEYWIMSENPRPEFEERLSEICGLYVEPPENALVVSLDEKTESEPKRRLSPTARRRRASRTAESAGMPAAAPSACSLRSSWITGRCSGWRQRPATAGIGSGSWICSTRRSRSPRASRSSRSLDNLSTLGTDEVRDWLAEARAFQFTSQARVVAEPDRNLLLDPVAAAAQARHLHQRDRSGTGH